MGGPGACPRRGFGGGAPIPKTGEADLVIHRHRGGGRDGFFYLFYLFSESAEPR